MKGLHEVFGHLAWNIIYISARGDKTCGEILIVGFVRFPVLRLREF